MANASKRGLHVLRALDLSSLQIRSDATEMPEGVCGIVECVALVYNAIDAYGTRFLPGCLDRSKREKLAAGKVKFYADHDGRTRTHIGFAKALETKGDKEVMTAYLFDTDAGRTQKEYLAACQASGGYTGFSIGFYEREAGTAKDGVYEFREIELDEVSNTPRPAVTGADLLGVRTEHARSQDDTRVLRIGLRALFDVLGLDAVRAEMASYPTATPDNATRTDTPLAPESTPLVPTANAAPTDSRVTLSIEERRALLLVPLPVASVTS